MLSEEDKKEIETSITELIYSLKCNSRPYRGLYPQMRFEIETYEDYIVGISLGLITGAIIERFRSAHGKSIRGSELKEMVEIISRRFTEIEIKCMDPL